MTLRSLFQGMLLSAFLFGAFRTGVLGQDTSKTTGGPQSIETKAAKATPIPNFAAVYGLSFNSTGSLAWMPTEGKLANKTTVLTRSHPSSMG